MGPTARGWSRRAAPLLVALLALGLTTGIAAAAPRPGTYTSTGPHRTTATLTRAGGALRVSVAFTARGCAASGRRVQVPGRLRLAKNGAFGFSGHIRGVAGSVTVRGRFVSATRMRATITLRQGTCVWRVGATSRRASDTRPKLPPCKAPQVQAWITPAGTLSPDYRYLPGSRPTCWPAARSHSATWNGASHYAGTDDTDAITVTFVSAEETWDFGVKATFALESAQVMGGGRATAHYAGWSVGGWSVNRTRISKGPDLSETCITAGQGQIAGAGGSLDINVDPAGGSYRVGVAGSEGYPAKERCSDSNGDSSEIDRLEGPAGNLIDTDSVVALGDAIDPTRLAGARDLDLGQTVIGALKSAPISGRIQWALTAGR